MNAAATIAQTLAIAARELRAYSDSPRLDAELLLGKVLGLSRSSLIAHDARLLEASDESAYADLIHQRVRGVPIVNGGSGADEHPTQALLDIYTLQHAFSFESRKDSSRRSRFDDLRRRSGGKTPLRTMNRKGNVHFD